MIAVKALLVGAVGLFVFITLLSLLIPAHPKVSRTIVINTASKEKVMSQLQDLGQWKNWHPAFSSDSVAVTFGKVKEGEGATCTLLYKNTLTQLSVTKVDTASVMVELRSKGENDITNQIFVNVLQPMA